MTKKSQKPPMQKKKPYLAVLSNFSVDLFLDSVGKSGNGKLKILIVTGNLRGHLYFPSEMHCYLTSCLC